MSWKEVVPTSSDVRMNELFKIGIGPSSSHTVGPMRAASAFLSEVGAAELLNATHRVTVVLRGSLAATGRGHGTPGAVIAGLEGHDPATCDPAVVRSAWQRATAQGSIQHADKQIRVDELEFRPLDPHADHPNAVDFTAYSTDGRVLLHRTYLSIGGGFIERAGAERGESERLPAPYVFRSFADLSALCATAGFTVAELMAANETAAGVDYRLTALAIWEAMDRCISAGQSPGAADLPGDLRVRRRAPDLARRLQDETGFSADVSRIQVDALAVNEENALGNRVVTAPTNGAAGILPAVIAHHLRSIPDGADEAVVSMLLTATALGAIIKTNASISGAQVGCQGEVGSACAMAAGALCAALGGTVSQVGKAAEMGLEHHLGLTCDPVGGLVQIPCIERNAIAAVTAVQAATLTLQEGHHPHVVSFDTAVTTMRRVGADMHDKYKETSLGGLAVSVVEC